ncbi:hypothetical protein QFC19_001907 [Naganishia cerealis]|uniref:Uncharacterized protein n=1 Tax=Naganishia cerealis TaxID=610337 RepID=A0ACC2WET5_9TREE|nr:hypothetical protein QFC19_001907 [Naganishia cerealis]
MSARLWPAKQSILPVLPTTPVTARLNLNGHKLNHPTRVHLWKDQLAEEEAKVKDVYEQVLSRRKDHTVPTRWGLYRSLVRNAQRLDQLLVANASQAYQATWLNSPLLKLGSASSQVITNDIRARWKRNRATQGYQRVRVWLSLEYEASVGYKAPLYFLLEEMESSLKGDSAALNRISERRALLYDRIVASRRAKHERKRRDQRAGAVKKERAPRIHPSFLAPTLFNIALPRMKPQPLSLSKMIDDRIKRRNRRREDLETHKRWAHDMLFEENFYRDLGIPHGPNSEAHGPNPSGNIRTGKRSKFGHRDADHDDLSFTERHFNHVNLISTYFERDAARAATTYTQEMIDAVKDARTRREQRRQRLAARRKGKDGRGSKAHAANADEV